MLSYMSSSSGGISYLAFVAWFWRSSSSRLACSCCLLSSSFCLLACSCRLTSSSYLFFPPCLFLLSSLLFLLPSCLFLSFDLLFLSLLPALLVLAVFSPLPFAFLLVLVV